ncbi:hypothetical protein E2C01_012787 [Portunus trituberculatus]|uniref:Uncharacterized protein n=1 Tax=Portunus trituberculatus TaxID=210409 RepID=A0A5B7DFK0_PORTR|nr:hypothetical protein [Portunus trituberculatus]
MSRSFVLQDQRRAQNGYKGHSTVQLPLDLMHNGRKANEQLLLAVFITQAFHKFALPSTTTLFSSEQNFIRLSENPGCTFRFLLNKHEWSPEFRSVFIHMLVYAEALPVLTTMKCSSRVGEASALALLLERNHILFTRDCLRY